MDRRPAVSRWPLGLRALLVGLAAVPVLLALSETALAHAAALRGSTTTVDVPTWLFLATGGGAVGASFLLASFVTDRTFIRAIHEWGRTLPAPGHLLTLGVRLLGVGLLAGTVAVGYLGPPTGFRNFAVLLVWVVWWGGYVASTYLIGNMWPTLNPFRTLAGLVPSVERPYPDRLGTWPSVVGLLGLIWLEVISPLADDPRLLASTLVGYTLVTVAGSVVYGTETWFSRVDPIARAFALFGRFAPFERTTEGIELRLPGTALSEAGVADGRDEVAFVVGLLYVTTFDGFVATGLWSDVATAVVGVGVPPLATYLLAYLGGFALFLGAFWWSMGIARQYGKTYITRTALAERFAPSLVAIAAGYHVAHNLGFLLGLLPSVTAVGAAPLSPPQQPPVVAALPGWVSGIELTLVLVGHFVAVWVAHAAAYELLPGRLEAIKSQYGITLVMVAYTMISLWIVTTPTVAPPFLGGGGV
ncbi:hypothetical protein EGH24_09965 [Halonotius terrestris]|uniref:Uncharacterized protein n=1 Tax=Halonotius terrestris TaxID=2487750 RepID=A0A8J8PAT2_9EURY|nr:hypothetical protein [Halonotius terrestris]TQQ79810.1 hypothetical protein EGH24_09965 [Halonotius terrestris]